MIFGESKGPTDDPDGVVTETKGKISVLEAHQSEIKEKYIGEELGREFVLGVLASDTNEVAKSVVRKGGGIVVWSIDFSNEPILSLHRPDLGKSEKDKAVRATMFHNNQRLNQALYKLATSDEFKSFYVQSHRVTKLKILTAVDKGREDRTFGFDDVKALVREALDYLDEETIKQESRGILESAIKISFVREVSPGRYKIKSRSKNAGIRADDIVRLWIEHKLHEERRQLIDAEFLLLQELFRGKKAAIPSLEGFDIWDNSKVGTSSAN